MQLPDFQDFRFSPVQDQQTITRNAVTSSDSWLTTFLSVNKNGKQASYYWLGVYTSSFYALSTDEQGAAVVKLIKRLDVPGDYKYTSVTQWNQRRYQFDIENLAGQIVLFPKPTA